MFETVESFFLMAEEKLKLFGTFATRYLVGLCVPDHIGYKCNSAQEFESLRQLLEPKSFFVYQSYISARRIAVFKLQVPLYTTLGEIHFLELSDQKSDGSQVSGFDHIEVSPANQSFETVVDKLFSQNIQLQKSERPHHTTWDLALSENFKLRIEPEPLIQKIKQQEMN